VKPGSNLDQASKGRFAATLFRHDLNANRRLAVVLVRVKNYNLIALVSTKSLSAGCADNLGGL
jgi:hypothetical protein